jgi:gas vesicle protein
MTNTFSSDPYGSGATTGTDASGGTGGGASDLKEQAKNVASDAGDAGKHVVGVAKEETRGVASETKTQARRLVSQVGTELRDQASNQKSRAASGIRDVGSQFEQMADSSDSGVAANLVRDAGRRVGQVGDWLDQREPKDLLDEVKRFARRRPGVFLAIAAGAGVVVGRLTRALASSGDDSNGAHAASTSGTSNYVGTPATTVPPVTAPPVTPPRTTEPPATTTIGNPAVPGGTPGTTGTIGGAGLNPGTGGI